MIATVVGGHAIKHLFNAGFFVLLPEIKTTMHLSNAAVGAISTSRQISGGIVNFPAGFLADRYPEKWAIILGLSIGQVGLYFFLLGLAPNYGVIVLAGILSNIAITLWHPSAISALSRRFSSRRGFVISLHGMGGSIGEALGPITAGGLLLVLGWRYIFQSALVPGIVAGLSIWILLKNLPVEKQPAPSLSVYFDSLRNLFKSSSLLIILVVVAGFTTSQGIIYTFLPIYLREDMGYSSFQTGVYLSVAMIGGIGSQPIMGYLSDRFDRQRVLFPGLIGLALTVTGLYIVSSDRWLLFSIALMGAFSFPLMAILLAAGADVVGERLQATSVSLVFGAAMVFGGISPVIGGALADAFQIKTTFLLAGLVAALSSVIVFVQILMEKFKTL